MDWLTQARRRFSRVGAAFCVMLVVWIVCNVLATILLTRLVGDGSSLPVWAVYLASSGPLYVIAVPVAVLVMRPVPPLHTRRFSLSPGRFFSLLIMCLPIMYVGNIIGTMLSSLLSQGTAVNEVSELALENDLSTVVFAGVLAPIVEEWVFRKQIIDRTRRYGEQLSIVLSALMFALFHLNLYQFFYAFGLGLMFGYVYMRTSRLRYSIAMHMIINLNGSVLAPWVLSQVDMDALDAMASGDEQAMQSALAGGAMNGFTVLMMYGLALIGLSIAGLVLLITKRRSFVFYHTPEELPHGMGARTAFGNPGMVVYIVLTVAGAALSLL